MSCYSLCASSSFQWPQKDALEWSERWINQCLLSRLIIRPTHLPSACPFRSAYGNLYHFSFAEGRWECEWSKSTMWTCFYLDVYTHLMPISDSKPQPGCCSRLWFLVRSRIAVSQRLFFAHQSLPNVLLLTSCVFILPMASEGSVGMKWKVNKSVFAVSFNYPPYSPFFCLSFLLCFQ
jgi:hypothetical protein